MKLTPRQQEILLESYRRGFFDHPRKINAGELAVVQHLGRYLIVTRALAESVREASPEALVRVLEAMKARISPEAHDFSSTHPSPEVRIAYIKAAIALLPPTQGPLPTAAELERRRARYLAALAGL